MIGSSSESVSWIIIVSVSESDELKSDRMSARDRLNAFEPLAVLTVCWESAEPLVPPG